jgi:hypothetical protein
LLSQRIRELVILEGHSVCAPCAVIILALVSPFHLVPDLLEVAWLLRLHSRQDLKLSASAPTDISKYRKLLIILVARALLVNFAKKH